MALDSAAPPPFKASAAAAGRLTTLRPPNHPRPLDGACWAPVRTAPAGAPGAGVVYVSAAPLRHRRAVCTCGWRGRPRWWRAIAVLDALTHARDTGCQPANPLVWPVPICEPDITTTRTLSAETALRTTTSATPRRSQAAAAARRRIDRRNASDLAHMGRMGPCP